MLGIAAQAQTTQPVLPPGKLAVFKAGTTDGLWPMVTARVAPCFVQVFDPAVSNIISTSALVTVPLSTNSATPGSVWINHHAGSEGGGLSRSVNRQFLALEGYVGNILSPAAAKPSTDPTVGRGIVTLDAFTNAISVLSTPTGWFGIPLGSNPSTQDNPTGIASTDGTNFYGTGNFAPVGTTAGELDGTLYYNSAYGPSSLQEVQQSIQAAGEARVIGGTLMVATKPTTGVASGLYNFIDPSSGNVVPLPWDPDVANPYFNFAFTNLYLNWGSKFKTILNFDMNPAQTIAYGADQTYGIVKFTNNAGNWVAAPYYFSATNIGSLNQASGNQGCFGITVDFSGQYPVIYATTMENGASNYYTGGLGVNTAAGHQNNNRLIKIVDSGNPGTNFVATTLAVASTINEFFGGVDFTPDLRPLITTQPAGYATTTSAAGSLFTVVAQSASALSYQWLENGAPVTAEISTNATLDLTSLTSIDNYNPAGFTNQYQVVITNAYGAVTSAVASLVVTVNPTAPVITSASTPVTAYVNGTVVFAPVNVSGTEPYTYQWYHAGIALADDSIKYYGSQTASLSITNVQTPADAGSYTLVVSNPSSSYASNVVDVLTVKYAPANIAPGEPLGTTTFVGTPTKLTADETGATAPVTYQWYSFTSKATNAVASSGEFVNASGTYGGGGSSALTINATVTNDSASYYIVFHNGAGYVTNAAPAVVSVVVPPAHSFVSYTNQTYTQNFDALPDPGYAGVAANGTASGNGVSVNSLNNPDDGGLINGVQYSLANPFDFAYPVIGNGYIGGLGLSTGATNMNGWYGVTDTNAADGVDIFADNNNMTVSRFGAQDGDQSTGGIIDFGLNDVEGGVVGTNRALGLISTGSTGSSAVGLKLVNNSTNTLNYINVNFLGEMWRNNKAGRTLSFSYTVDTAGTFALQSEPEFTNNTPQQIPGTVQVPGLSFSLPTDNGTVLATNGLLAANQVPLSTNNLALATPWTPGSTLWLIWSVNYYGQGTGQGYAIDNLKVGASVAPITVPTLGAVSTAATLGGANGVGATIGFTNSPGAAGQFTLWATTNLALPFSQWVNLGHPAEVSSGVYSIEDTKATNVPARFYQVTSP